MKINLDDPKLTAFALGELPAAEEALIQAAVAESDEAQALVRQTQQLARLLRQEFRAELHHVQPKPLSIMPLPGARSFWSDAKWMSIGLAALLAVAAVIAAVLFSNGPHAGTVASSLPKRAPADLQMEVTAEIPDESATLPDLRVFRSAAKDLSALQLPLTITPLAPPAPYEGAEISAFYGNTTESDAKPKFTSQLNSDEDFGGTPRVSNRFSDVTGFSRLTSRDGASAIYGSDAVAGVVNFVTAASSRGRRSFFDQDHYRYAGGKVGDSEAAGERGNHDTAGYDHFEENPFLPARTNPLSTFSLDVDTASYANVRRLINAGTRPPRGAVRIEEMINYFTYDYAQPLPNEPFSINLDLTTCPWEPTHQLVRIGLKAREIPNEERGASNLVFLLDVSGSMAPAERLPLIKQAMRLLVEQLTENDRVAIVIYAGASGLALPSTTCDHKQQILAALDDLRASGSTNGAAGIELAYKIAAENFIKGGVNRVLLATDGDFNVGVTSQSELVRLAEEKAKSGVFLSVLGVGTDNLQDSTMQKLADKGNGNYAYLDSLEEARKVLVQQINGTLVTVAKDVKAQVEFNPARVASYRLLGYEKRILRKEDFNDDKIDAGEIGAGHTVTALYEVVPVGAAESVPPVDPLKYQPAPTFTESALSELLTVKLRYKKPDGDRSELLQHSLGAEATKFRDAPVDFRFAAAVAEFGMILRDSPHKGTGTLSAVAEWAAASKGSDEAGYRAGFLDLVHKAAALAF